MVNNRLTSKSETWRTPIEILRRADALMGGIDLDPASSHEANMDTRATRYFQDDRGMGSLDKPWGTPESPSRIWLNPPGGKFPKGHPLEGVSRVKAFWAKLTYEYRMAHVSQACFLSFSMEAAQTTQVYQKELENQDNILCWPTVFFSRRLAFRDGTGKPVKGNTHGSCLTYLGSAERLHGYFGDLGVVVIPHWE